MLVFSCTFQKGSNFQISCKYFQTCLSDSKKNPNCCFYDSFNLKLASLILITCKLNLTDCVMTTDYSREIPPIFGLKQMNTEKQYLPMYPCVVLETISRKAR